MKKFSSRFSIAVHVLCLIALNPSLSTGDAIAASVNTNPVIIRNIIAKLKKAGLISVRSGVGGAFLRKELEQITLLDVYRAVEVADHDALFHIHEDPNPNCPIGKNIITVLRSEFQEAQSALEQRLAQVSLQQVVTNFDDKNGS